MDCFGEALRNEREKKNISLENIASKTNISLSSLIALENGKIDHVPGAFYLKNYIKTFLNAIDADTNEFLKTYKEKIEGIYEKKHETSETYWSKLKYSRFKKKNVLFTILLTVILFIIVFYFIYINRENIFSGWDSKSRIGSIPATGINLTAFDSHKNFSRDYSPLNVYIEFFDQCWIQVYRGKEKIIEKIYKKGEILSTNGYDLTVHMGNPAGLRFSLNGKEITYLRKLSKPEKIILTPANVDRIFQK